MKKYKFPVLLLAFILMNVFTMGQTVESKSMNYVPSSKMENYLESPNIEGLMGSNFRSESVKVTSPKNTDQYTKNEKITFKWDECNSTGSLFLKIIDNAEKTVFEGSVSKSPYVLAKALPAGLYYWKLETEEDLLYVGKFMVK